MNRDQKVQAVERIAGEIEQSDAIVALDYRGLSVKQAAELRTALIDAHASFRIVKNTLTERAADQAGAESLKELLEGPTALTFVRGDIALAAKTLATFRRREGVLEVKGGRMNGAPLSVDQFEAIARLPALDALRGQFVGVLASPITTLVRGLGSMISGLAVALRQIEEQGLVGGGEQTAQEAPAEPEAAAAEEAPAESEAPAADEAPGEAAAETPAPAAEESRADAAEAEADAPAAESETPETSAAEPAEQPSEAPAAEPAEQPSEAPGDPVAEAEAAEETSESTPSEGESGSEEG